MGRKGISSGNNGLERIDRQMAAAAWMITTGPNHHASTTFIIAGMNKVTAYQAELEGTYRMLVHVDWLGLTMRELEH